MGLQSLLSHLSQVREKPKLPKCQRSRRLMARKKIPRRLSLQTVSPKVNPFLDWIWNMYHTCSGGYLTSPRAIWLQCKSNIAMNSLFKCHSRCCFLEGVRCPWLSWCALRMTVRTEPEGKNAVLSLSQRYAFALLFSWAIRMGISFFCQVTEMEL